MNELRIDPSVTGHPVSPRLFGLFFEDINFGLDGGLNANLVVNPSFEAISLDRRGHSFLLGAVLLHKEPKTLVTRGLHWDTDGGKLDVLSESALTEHGHYARLTVGTEATLTNHGYPGTRPGMGARRGVGLHFSARVRTDGFSGHLSVQLIRAAGDVVAAATVTVTGEGPWEYATAELDPSDTSLVSLRIVAAGTGHLDIDEVSLIPDDHWGAGDPRWSQGILRRDLVETIAAANPSFLRFPGGCIVEGLSASNSYDWKKTIGPIVQREGDFSLWSLLRPAGDYYQSQQIGFYEFFLLCEDLGIEPIPVVQGGLCCQNMAKGSLDIDGPEFAQLTQDVLDLIDWATGSPASSQWAAHRAAAGHPQPFTLKTLGIGNENHGPAYHERFARLREAVRERHPTIDVILSGSPGHAGRKYRETWKFARSATPGLIVDEHFYASPKWFSKSHTRYDNYDRSGPRVFVGEYAAQFPNVTTPKKKRPPANTYGSALAEAAFYTGAIRNSDIVVMTSYAPLLNLVEEGQWSQNFIDFNPLVVQPTVNYEMQKFFTDALGDFTVQLPVLPEGLLASATRTRDQLFLHLVNQTQEPIALGLEMRSKIGGMKVEELIADPGFRHALNFADTAASRLEPIVVGAKNDVVTVGASSVCRVIVQLEAI